MRIPVPQPPRMVEQQVRPQRSRLDPMVGSAKPGGYGFSLGFTSAYYGDPAAYTHVVQSEQFNRPPPSPP